MTIITAMLGAGLISLAGCKDNAPSTVKPPPPGVGVPTADAAPATATASLASNSPSETQPDYSDLEVLPKSNKGDLGPGPDGMTWLIFPTGIMTQDTKIGLGRMPDLGQTAWIAYIAKYADTHKECDRITKENPTKFRVGSTKEIRGLSLGILGMKTGGKRRIYIPANLAYGQHGDPTHHIAPNQALIYDVELLSVTGDPIILPAKNANNMFDNLLGPALPPGPKPPATRPAK